MDRSEYITIDVDKLRQDMRKESFGAYFGGGFGGALMEVADVERASPQKLIGMAKNKGINLREYETRGSSNDY